MSKILVVLAPLLLLADGKSGGSSRPQFAPHGLATDPDLRIIA